MNHYRMQEKRGSLAFALLSVLVAQETITNSRSEALQQRFITQYLRVFAKPDVLYRRVPENLKREFEGMLKEMVGFVTQEGAPRARALKKHSSYVSNVAERDRQRKEDMHYIEKIWTQLLNGMVKTYDYLAEKIVICGQPQKTLLDEIRNVMFTPVAFNKDGSVRYYLDAAKIDIQHVKELLGIHKDDHNSFAQIGEELARIRIRAVATQKKCSEEDCDSKFDLIIFHTNYLQTTLDALEHAVSAKAPLNQDALVNDAVKPLYSVEEYIKSHAVSSCTKK